MSGKHKAVRGRHRAVPLAGRHRKPAPGLNALSERTSMLAVTGAVAASTTFGGAMGMADRLPGAPTGETAAADPAGSVRAADRASRGTDRAGLDPGGSGVSDASARADAAERTGEATPPPRTLTRAPQAPRVAAGTAATRTQPAARSAQRPAPTSKPRRAEPPREAPPPQADDGPVRSCKASFYAEGQVTANGERFEPDGLTAAHKTLPFGTRVRVTNPKTGESVVVRINDRGPFVEGRCLDLSRGAFDDIASLGSGVIRVQYQVL